MQQLCRSYRKGLRQIRDPVRSLYAVANNHRVAVTASGPREAVDTRLRQMDR